MAAMTTLLNQTWIIFLLGAALIGAVLLAVHHAEVIAHKVGEPFGTLVLALSVTVIEVALIVSMMLAGHEGSEFIARDAIFATVMIIMNGVIGLCIFVGGLKHHELPGATAYPHQYHEQNVEPRHFMPEEGGQCCRAHEQ